MVDVAREKIFYESIFEIEMVSMDMMGISMLMFPTQSPKSGGALVKSTLSKHKRFTYLSECKSRFTTRFR